ncbi:FAD-dependent oxidoreductase [Nocardiopsis sp. ATB16-24]|uniref:FAD-dependent oxidoreductase n=1 Tax=Nocardiopsis sp. ATB16-24 TaxID=3019555 RepID=UPI0025531F75|nr:FAD-dependent oxidoreductase [Nocardiopsis sp. ATB16-24]
MPRATKRLDVVVVGAGIGGLATALALLKEGHRVRIYERAEELSEVGAGLQVSPNSTRVLEYLGVGEALAATGVRPERLESRDWEQGELLGTHEMNSEPLRYGAYHYLMRRADLLDALVSAVPAEVIHLGRTVVDIEQGDERAAIVLEGGERVEGDVVVGADGIHSTVSRLLFDVSKPRFSGTVAYRALLPAGDVQDLDLPNTSTKWWGPVVEHHLVHYYVSSLKTFNIIAVVPEEGWETESWTAKGEPEELVKAFADYADPIPELVRRAGTPLKWALHEREPLEKWSEGRFTLLGDSCHPMVPFLAQGAAMAIEDAVVLARALSKAEETGVEQALKVYETTRRSRTAHIQNQARSTPPTRGSSATGSTSTTP